MDATEYQAQINKLRESTKRPNLKRIIPISILVILVVAVLVFLFVSWGSKDKLASEVKADLVLVTDAMKKVAESGNGYPASLPTNLKTSGKVTLTGGGSFDGSVYCVTGVSNEDNKVVYHVDSSADSPKQGSCESKSSSTIPTIVSDFQITSFGPSQIAVSWKESLYATGYSLQCSTDEKFERDVKESKTAELVASCNELSPGKTYYLRAKSENEAGSSDWSKVLKISTEVASVAPSDLSLRPTSSTTVQYSWQPVNGAKEYVVEWSSDVNFVKDFKSVKQTSAFGISTGLKPGTKYFYHVKAVTKEFDASQAAFSGQVTVDTPK